MGTRNVFGFAGSSLHLLPHGPHFQTSWIIVSLTQKLALPFVAFLPQRHWDQAHNPLPSPSPFLQVLAALPPLWGDGGPSDLGDS